MNSRPVLMIAILFILLLVVTTDPISGSDWPQYRGPNHNGASPDPILKKWPAKGPHELWRVALTNGYGSLTVSENRVYTLDQRLQNDQYQHICIALDAESGKEIWEAPLETSHRYGHPPNSTPIIDGNIIIVLSNDLGLFCFDSKTGKKNWSKTALGIPDPSGNASSPTVDGDLVFVNCSNGSITNRVLAYNKSTGTLAWRSFAGSSPFSTPIPATIHGVRQIIFSSQTGIISLESYTGKLLWSYPTTNIPYASPLVVDDKIYFSNSRYNWVVQVIPSGDTYTVQLLWTKPTHSAYAWGTPVYYQGYIYSMDSYYSDYSKLRCQMLENGIEMWSQNGYSNGGILLADDSLLIMNGTGDLILLESNPLACKEQARFQVFKKDDPVYNHPAFSNGRVYARSTTEGVCYDLSTTTADVLRLNQPILQSNGQFELKVTLNSGNRLTPQRLNDMEVLMSNNFLMPLTNWIKITNITRQADGRIQFYLPTHVSEAKAYFLGVERP